LEHETHLRLKNYYYELTKEPRKFWIKPYRSFKEPAEIIYSPLYHSGMIFLNLLDLLKSIVEGNFAKTPFYSGTFCIQIWLAVNATVLFSLVLSTRGISTMFHLTVNDEKEQLNIVSEQRIYGTLPECQEVNTHVIRPSIFTGIFHDDAESDTPDSLSPNSSDEGSVKDLCIFFASIFGVSKNTTRRTIYEIEQETAFQGYIELLKKINEDTLKLIDANVAIHEVHYAVNQYSDKVLSRRNQILPLSFYHSWGQQLINDRYMHNLANYPSHHHLNPKSDLHEIKQITQELNAHHQKVMEDAQVLLPHIFEHLNEQLNDASEHMLMTKVTR
jgi:hypothetical protein